MATDRLGRPRAARVGFLACPAAGLLTGLEACAGSPLALQVETETSTEVPRLELTAPADTQSLLVLGMICVNGVPNFDAAGRSFSCAGEGARENLVSFEVSVAAEAETANRHPALAETAFFLGDSAWPDVADGCLDGGLSVDAGAGTQTLRFVLPGPARESYSVAQGEGAQVRRESLTLSHFVTKKDLERQFSVLESDDADGTELTLEWTPPSSAAVSEDTSVEFTWVGRDGRGGIDVVRRALCLRASGN